MRDAKLERREKEDQLAADIIDECRVQLMLKFRFLDRALWRMGLEPLRVHAAYPLATDGTRVVCDPPRVIARFQESFDESIRDYLHMVMHCIFRHPYDEDHVDREAWDLTCDMMVENAVMDLCGSRFESADDSARREALDNVRMLAGAVLPGKVYALVKALVQTPDGQQFRGMGRSTLNEWHALFERDDHGGWPARNKDARRPGDGGEGQGEGLVEDDEDPEVQGDGIHADSPEDSADDQMQAEQQVAAGQQDADDGAAEDEAGDADPQDASDEPEGPSDEADEANSSGSADADDASDDAAPPERDRPREDDPEADRREWEDIAKQIEMNLETFSREWGDEAGSLMASLAVANRKAYSYSDFLRRFMVQSEEMVLNQDEFDVICYTYGMDLYGNMPLIEPLEYKETDRVRDFAVVIDTSESVSGDMVRRFLAHTFQMLKSSEDYATEVNIHIIQCDARVQSDTKVTSLRDVDRMMEGFTVRGFGGTDFRPAFDYVDMLVKRGEFERLRGLIYFTDGFGTFPEKAPAYDAAFVFVDDEAREIPPVPPWACKLVLDEAAVQKMG